MAFSESPEPWTCCCGVGEWFCQSPWLLGLPSPARTVFWEVSSPRRSPHFPAPWAGSLQVCSSPVPCACWLSQNVGMGTKRGLHPGPIQNSAWAPAAAQRCLQGKYRSTAASRCRDNVSAQKSPPHPWQTGLAVAPRHKPACCPLELLSIHHHKGLGRASRVLHPAVVLLIIIPS